MAWGWGVTESHSRRNKREGKKQQAEDMRDYKELVIGDEPLGGCLTTEMSDRKGRKNMRGSKIF